MHKKIYSNEQLNSLINRVYSFSYMNDSKWFRLINAITSGLENGIFIKYKLIYSKKIQSALIDEPDIKPFFLEPTLYKEVEWIVIPEAFDDYINENNKKAGLRSKKQDLNSILNRINMAGSFEVEASSHAIKVFGYK